jgi:large subunit ribosomal protein L25
VDAAGRGGIRDVGKLEIAMNISFTVGADFRETQGKGASRRLRHTGKVPAILYGGGSTPRALTLDQRYLLTLIDNEKFYSSIIQIKVGEETQPAIVKDVQMHPAKNAVVHVDLQRVLENEKIRIRLPIHFRNQANAPGVKTQGGVVSHRMSDVEVACLPKDLPEFLELDLGKMGLNDTLFLADVPLPEGVIIPELAQGKNAAVVSVHAPRAEEPEPTAVAAAGAVPAEGAAAAPAAAGAEGKKEDAKPEAAKKEGGKK